MKIKKYFSASLLVLLLCLPSFIWADLPEEKISDLIDGFLKTEFLNAESCEDFKKGMEEHKKYKDELLKVDDNGFSTIMERFDTEESLDEIQRQWLYSLLEELCIKNPEFDKILLDSYEGYYNLLAACRTRESIISLAEQADDIFGYSGLEYLLDLFSDETPSHIRTNLEDMSSEEQEELKHLLILLSIDGENINALETLIDNYDNAFFFVAVRYMEMIENRCTSKPYITKEYKNEIIDCLDEDLNSDLMGMVLDLDKRMNSVRKHLLEMELKQQDEILKERDNTAFFWLISKKLDKGTLDDELINKYLQFLYYNKIETLEIRRLFGKVYMNSKDPEFKNSIQDFIKRYPVLATADEVEICIYPELSNTVIKTK